MAIAEQFAGVQMDKLIGAPLAAAADASIQLAGSTADFINRVGFEPGGKLRTAAFAYQSRSVNEDGTSNLDEMKIEVPMLAIVPVPNLQVDEVNILFDMEVKQSEKQDSALNLGASASGNMNFGVAKVNITGHVSAHSTNTRSTDNSAKYHVDVRATNHGTPEGLARVLDMMAANIAPTLTATVIRGADGQELNEADRVKAEELKVLRGKIRQLEHCLNAAKEGLDLSIAMMHKAAAAQQNTYQGNMRRLMNGLNQNNEADRKKADAFIAGMDEVNQSWNYFSGQIAGYVQMIADSGDMAEENALELFGLKAWKNGKAEKYDRTESGYKMLATMQKRAVESQCRVNRIETELYEAKTAYSDSVAGRRQEARLEQTAGKTTRKDVAPESR